MSFKTDFIKTDDDIRIAFDQYINGFKKVIIIAHGFYFNKDIFVMKKLAEVFSNEYDVITFDFRGHGKSGDFFTWTALEDKDLRAIVDYAKNEGYEKVAVLGFSLGGATAIIEASYDIHVDNVIAVSSPYDVWKINFRIWEKEVRKDIELNLSFIEKGKGVRPGSPLIRKVRPIDVVQKISPRSILFIQGDEDWLVKAEHGQKLFEKAKRPKKLETIKGAGHAENIFVLFPEQFIKICDSWLEKTF
ncbi:MAG: alpha/beta fold hydrolase [Elusimicrobia bacterium]|nr:alpha/beta fold hydrolase [Elusimicrobiota bacterium]